MLRKARAAVLLRFRGERLPTLTELRQLTITEECGCVQAVVRRWISYLNTPDVEYFDSSYFIKLFDYLFGNEKYFIIV